VRVASPAAALATKEEDTVSAGDVNGKKLIALHESRAKRNPLRIQQQGRKGVCLLDVFEPTHFTDRCDACIAGTL
jgi:hypothetical protein